MIEPLQICKSVVVLNGDLSGWLDSFQGLPIVAADGAANKLHAINITPDFIVGDFDSITVEPSTSTKLIRQTDQDTTDFEKSLALLAGNDLLPAIVLGVFGSELDHSLHNLQLSSNYPGKLLLRNQYGYGLFLESTKVEFTMVPNANISILPFPQALVSTEGLRWDLSNALLEQGGSTSVRNQAVTTQVSIEIVDGKSLLIGDFKKIHF